jgi:hypothetical protein
MLIAHNILKVKIQILKRDIYCLKNKIQNREKEIKRKHEKNDLTSLTEAFKFILK